MSEQDNLEFLDRGGWWEKRGNTSWVRCGTCAGWFLVALAMMRLPGMRLHCPDCGANFLPADAGRIVVSE